MVVALVLLAGLIVLGVAGVRGWLPDTRDPEFGMGKVSVPREVAPPATASPGPI